MQIYLVGGAVRDEILGIDSAATDKDYVVVGSSVEQMLKLGYHQVGKAFPVFLHPQTKCEYALARLEQKTALGYHGFSFDTSAKVTLEQDLSRRDLTINAMAKDKNGDLIDPFNGAQDLKNRCLRHISDAFIEDPLRVLRVARFAARFASYGFKVDTKTQRLLKKMVSSGEIDTLVPERIFQELNKALSYPVPSPFFQVLRDCEAYFKVFAALSAPKNNFELLDNNNANNALIQFAIWLHNEKPAAISALCQRLKCPKKYQQLALLSAQWFEFATNFKSQSPELVFNFYKATDALRQKQRFADLLAVFACLNADTKPIVALKNQLDKIDTTTLNGDIATAIVQQKRQLICSFFNATK